MLGGFFWLCFGESFFVLWLFWGRFFLRILFKRIFFQLLHCEVSILFLRSPDLQKTPSFGIWKCLYVLFRISQYSLIDLDPFGKWSVLK